MALTRIKTAPTRKHLHLEAWWRYWDVNVRWCRRFDAKKRRKQAHYAELDQRRLNKQTRKSESVSTSAVIMKTSRLSLKLLFGVSGLALALTLSAMPASFWPGFLLIIGALLLAVLFVIGLASLLAYAFGDSNVGFGFFIGGN